MVSNLHPYHHVVTNDHETLTVYPVDGGSPILVNSDHPYFSAIFEGAKDSEGSDADDLRALADLTVAAAKHFDAVGDRVSVANGRIYFDGDEVDNVLTKQIRRFMDAGEDAWRPLIAFMENITTNENEHSREQLYAWLASRDFSITEDGCFVAYKGVGGSEADGWKSLNAGDAIVNGEAMSGRIPNAVGDTIEMPRSSVQHDPAVGCSTGLHVGTFSYAQSYARGAMLQVIVNPRDVVSVPSGEDEKMRVCRYYVAEVIDAPATTPVVSTYVEDDDCEDCGQDYWDCKCQY